MRLEAYRSTHPEPSPTPLTLSTSNSHTFALHQVHHAVGALTRAAGRAAEELAPYLTQRKAAYTLGCVASAGEGQSVGVCLAFTTGCKGGVRGWNQFAEVVGEASGLGCCVSVSIGYTGDYIGWGGLQCKGLAIGCGGMRVGGPVSRRAIALVWIKHDKRVGQLVT